MVKELVMDNMYSPDTLSARMKGADKSGFENTGTFQNIFDNKNNYAGVDNKFSYGKDLAYRNTSSNHRGFSSDNNDFVKQDRVFSSTTTNQDKLTNTPAEEIKQDNFTVSDGYSFSIRDSLQEKSSEVDSSESPAEIISLSEEDTEAPVLDDTESVDSLDINSEKTDINPQITVLPVSKNVPAAASELTTVLLENPRIADTVETSEDLTGVKPPVLQYNPETVIDTEKVKNTVLNAAAKAGSVDVDETLQTLDISETDVNEAADNSIQLTDGSGWEVLDKDSQYEYTDSIALSDVAETDTIFSETADTGEAAVNTDVNLKTDTVNKESGSILKSGLQTEIPTDIDIAPEPVSKKAGTEVNIDKETNIDNRTGIDSIEPENQSIEPDSMASDIEILEKDTSENQEVQTKIHSDIDLKTVSADEQSDLEAEPAVIEKKEEEITIDDSDLEIDMVSESDNLTNDENHQSNEFKKSRESIDESLEERTRLAYVDMTDVSDSSENDVLAQLESRFGSEVSEEVSTTENSETVNINDFVNNADADTELPIENKIKASSLEDVVDEKMADDLGIQLKDSSSSESGQIGANSTAEQLIRYSIEGETGFDNRLSSIFKQNAPQQSSGLMTNSREILAQINEKLTTFNFRPGAKLTMQLSPENLGTVEIKLTNTLDGIRAEMTATSDDAGNALNKHIDDLRDTLQKYGVRLDRVSVSTTQPQQSNAQQDYTEQGSSQRQQQEQQHQQKEERGAQKFEDMVSSLYEEGHKE